MQPFGLYLTHESRVIVLGLPRFGKTRLIRDVLTSDCERVLFHDITGHDYYAPGRLPVTVEELEAHPYLLEQDYMRIVVIAQSASDPDVILDEVKRIQLLVWTVGNMVVVFDEVGAHARKSERQLNSFFARGSHHRIATILAAQKATDIPLGARVTCSDCYCFGQHHPKELQALYDCYGDKFAVQASEIQKGSNPIHWREDDRADWWTEASRNKFRSAKAAMQPEVVTDGS